MRRLLVGTPIVVGDSTLLVVARVVIEAERSDHACWIYANKAPYALMIRDARGLRAVDMTGRRLLLAELAKDLPDLQTI